MGTRLARVSSRSQILHPAGNNTLISASPASASQLRLGRGWPRATCWPGAALSRDELSSATPAEMYSFSLSN